MKVVHTVCNVQVSRGEGRILCCIIQTFISCIETVEFVVCFQFGRAIAIISGYVLEGSVASFAI